MKRGDVYRVYKPGGTDPKKFRFFVIVSRWVLIQSKFSTLICAPVYSRYDGLSTQIPVGTSEGLKKDSAVHCDELVSLPKSRLTNFACSLPLAKIEELNQALKMALELDE